MPRGTTSSEGQHDKGTSRQKDDPSKGNFVKGTKRRDDTASKGHFESESGKQLTLPKSTMRPELHGDRPAYASSEN